MIMKLTLNLTTQTYDTINRKPKETVNFKTHKGELEKTNLSIFQKVKNYGRVQKELKENLTDRECLMRLAVFAVTPMLSVIDWYKGSYWILLFSPCTLYLELTALTLYCPIKASFSNFRRKLNN